jgi:hypothetical protein
MTQPPLPGHGPGPEPSRDPGTPGGAGSPSAPDGQPRRDPRLAGFAQHGPGDTCPPGPELAALVADLSGPHWRCDGATDDELIGLLNRWAALESWAAAGKLGVTRELLRRRAVPLPGTAGIDGLPEVWDDGTGHEVAAALSISLQGADKLANLAWTLQARLPGIGAKLADGTIDIVKAGIIAKELFVLDDTHAAEAEALILDDLAGKTPGQIGKLAAAAVDTVDPEGAQKRREYAEREDARVRMWRETSGASAMAAYGLPTDAALSANANIDQRAKQYKKAGVVTDARMDQLRVLAFADMLNGITLADRITLAEAEAQARAQAQAGAGSETGTDPSDGPADDGSPGDGDQPADGTRSPEDRPGPGSGQDGDPNRDNGDNEKGDGGNGGAAAAPQPAPKPAGPGLAARSNLTLPLATLLGLAERPGEGHGLGPLDPALVRDLAAAAARSPHSTWCLTITDPGGHAIGHGCAKPARKKQDQPRTPAPGSRDGPWSFTRNTDDPGPPGGYGTWTLTVPGGQPYTVTLGPVPVDDCDHRHESRGYQPSGTLRHLVEIRDGECTFPCCSRHAASCDFEHAIPHAQGGRPAPATAGPAAAAATRSSSPRAGPSPSPGPAGISGPPPAAAPTPKDPSDTPTERYRPLRRG